jgi:hypothetical protein
MKIHLALALAVLPLTAGNLSASPVTYQIDFTVGSTSTMHGGPFTPGHPDGFTYQPAIGDVFHALVTLDDGFLATDGEHVGLPLDGFRLEIAGLAWDPNDPSSVFTGFRGPGLFAPSPILVSSGGALTGMKGGVFGVSDVPYVDFLTDGSFAANDGENIITGGMQAPLPVSSVPEPGTPWALGAGMAGLLAFSRRLLFRTA